MKDYPPTAQVLIHLLCCAVNETACALKPDEFDFDGLYSLAKNHGVCAAVAFALESAGIEEPRFVQQKRKAKRRIALFDIEREKIFEKLNEAGIWHLPLKGIVLKDFYPSYGMREMTDNDILCDSEKMDQVREIMESLGFSCGNIGKWHHDTYQKPPSLEFEMHHHLFLTDDLPALDSYYENVFDRLLPKGGCEYAFSDEDFYIYMLAHEYKHFSHCGTGLRALMDRYVFLRTHQALDMEYIGRELEMLGIAEFEQSSRTLCEDLFGGCALSEEEAQLLLLFLDSSLYGTVSQGEYNELTRQLDGKDTKSAKTKYFFDRVFVRGASLEKYHPFFSKHKWLLPAFYVYRPIKAVFTNPKAIVHETKNVVKYHPPKKRW